MAINQFVARNGLISLDDTTISGSLFVSQSATIKNGLTATGSVRITGSTTHIGNITITGSILMATGSNALFASIRDVQWIDFVTGSDQPIGEGRLGWNNSDGTLGLGLRGGNVELLVGEAEFAFVYNAEATTLNKGEVVYIFGAQGNRVSVKRASAINDANSAGTLGFVAESITSGNTGIVITNGVFPKLDTSGLSEGALLYVSSSAGQYTTTPPTAPLHTVRLGYVQRSHPNVGSIYVKVDNGYELGELHDLIDTTTTSSYGDLLIKSGSVWTNSKILSGSYTLSGSLTTNDGIWLNSLTASFISASSGITGSLFGTASFVSGSVFTSTNPALSASYAATASYALNSTTIDTGSFATTGSNVFNGNQTITGSLTISGSSLIVTGTLEVKSNPANFYPIRISTNTDTLGLGGGIIGDESGLYSTNADQVIAAFDTTNNSYYYANTAYTYDVTNSTHNLAYKLKHGENTIVSGAASHAEGIGTITYGNASHAEGSSTYTGQLGYLSNNINSGEITLEASYGDVKNYIDGLTGYIILDDREYDNIYGCQLFEISSITSATPTIIYLVDADVDTLTAKIGVPGVAQPTNADAIIEGRYAHSEGSSSIASGYYSHTAGEGTSTIGISSYAGGSGSIAYRPGQTVVGQFNLIDRENQDHYNNSFVIGKGTNVSTRNNIFSVQPNVDELLISASTVYVKGLINSPASAVVTINPTTGQLYYTASSAFGGSTNTLTTGKVVAIATGLSNLF